MDAFTQYEKWSEEGSNGWIDVNDHLPGDADEYEGVGYYESYFITYWSGEIDSPVMWGANHEKKWRFDDGSDATQFVSYWRPMLRPPQNKE